jgi:endonuclease/exonuclease/phosphatase family metal-dependent hydrolase
VDIVPTALAHLRVELVPAWELDGRVVGLGSGPSTNPNQARIPDTLRILAYNTHHGEGMDGALDLVRIGEFIEATRPDLVALQEIDRFVERTGWIDQAFEYGSLTGMDPLFGEFMAFQGGHYGMALLSRFPIMESTNILLPPGPEPRSALAARVRLPGSGREVVFVGIHFYRTEEERLAQARSLMYALEGEEGLVILAGDFNSQPGSAVMDLLGSQWDVLQKRGGPHTFPANNPDREIDFVLVRPRTGFRILEHRVMDERVASDHRPVFLVLEVQ